MLSHPKPAMRTLNLLLQALADRPARVTGVEAASGEMPQTATLARPVLTDTTLLLPPPLPAHDHRAAVAHAAAHWLFSTPHQPAGKLKPMTLAVIGSLEDARVEHLLAKRFPGTRQWFLRALRQQSDEGLGFGDLLARLARALWDTNWVDPNPWVSRARERVGELVARTGWHDAAALRQLASVLANELGQMRVRMPADHIEPVAYRDDHSWLWQHEATREQAVMLEASEVQSAAQGGAHETATRTADPRITRHPEWDHRIGVLKPGWTTVHEYSANLPFFTSKRSAYPSLIDERRPRQARRQPDGPALDLDACVQLRLDQAQGLPTDTRVFQRHLPQPQPFAALVLLDLSNSMNMVLHGSPLHALARRAGLSLVRTARRLGGAAALHGFSSNTRHAVRYECLLDFDVPLTDAALAHLHAAPTCHSTRLGAALRHATRGLLARPEARRLLLVVTDGAPSDVDVFEPRHLVEDARHAVQAARRSEVDVLCLATGQEDAAAIRRIFGLQAHAVRDLQLLPQRLQSLLLQALT